MDFTEVKRFLRVDFTDDDDYIALLIKAAEEYISNAVTTPNKESSLYTLAIYFIVSNLYEHRSYTVDKANEKVAYVMKSMLMQLDLGDV